MSHYTRCLWDLPRCPLAASKYYNRLLINYLEAEAGFWVMQRLFHWSTREVKGRSNRRKPKATEQGLLALYVLEALLQEDDIATERS